MKKFFKIFGIVVLILILFRGFIFRFAINYTEIGSREKVEITNQKLIGKIISRSKGKRIGVESIAEIADQITRSELRFATSQTSNNPNELIDTKKAHCIGYSAMYNSIANYLIVRNDLQNEVESKHLVGKLDLFGINLHQFFDNSFFRDHDFNEVTNKRTGEKIFIDPSVSDYFRINKISKRE